MASGKSGRIKSPEALAKKRSYQRKYHRSFWTDVPQFPCEVCSDAFPTYAGKRGHESTQHGLRSRRLKDGSIVVVRRSDKLKKVAIRGRNSDSATLWAMLCGNLGLYEAVSAKH